MNTIAIVGRPNVGKSMLFNRLLGRQASLVYDQPGVTRDRIESEWRVPDGQYTLIDTGGIGLDANQTLAQIIAHEAEIAIEAADLLVWVVDGREGLVALDSSLFQRLRKSAKPVLLAINKMDEAAGRHFTAEFRRTGFPSFEISAAHGRGISNLVSAIQEKVSPAPRAADQKTIHPIRIALVGKPNVGKSSLVNAILGKERSITSPVPGTTRDEVEVRHSYEHLGQTTPILLVDTAGMRQKRRIDSALEGSMTGRTAHAINRADLCLLVLDATTGVSMQDKKIAGLLQKAMAPAVILINKWDLAKHRTETNSSAGNQKDRRFQENYADAVRKELFFLTHAPVLFTSAHEKSGLQDMFSTIDRVARNLARPIPTPQLNRILKTVAEQQPPPARSGKRFKILYATCKQGEKKYDAPQIVTFCNDHTLATAAWLTFAESRIRDHFSLEGCPIRWVWRDRNHTELKESTPHKKASHAPDRKPRERTSTRSRRAHLLLAGLFFLPFTSVAKTNQTASATQVLILDPDKGWIDPNPTPKSSTPDSSSLFETNTVIDPIPRKQEIPTTSPIDAVAPFLIQAQQGVIQKNIGNLKLPANLAGFNPTLSVYKSDWLYKQLQSVKVAEELRLMLGKSPRAKDIHGWIETRLHGEVYILETLSRQPPIPKPKMAAFYLKTCPPMAFLDSTGWHRIKNTVTPTETRIYAAP